MVGLFGGLFFWGEGGLICIVYSSEHYVSLLQWSNFLTYYWHTNRHKLSSLIGQHGFFSYRMRRNLSMRICMSVASIEATEAIASVKKNIKKNIG